MSRSGDIAAIEDRDPRKRDKAVIRKRPGKRSMCVCVWGGGGGGQGGDGGGYNPTSGITANA